MSLGQACPATPCTFEVSRKSEFIVTFEKEGYLPQQVPVATKLAGAGAAGFAGNVLVGGLVGMGVDAATGSTLEHFPNPVFATLVPDPATKPKLEAPARKVAKAHARAFRPEDSDPPDLPF